MTETTEATDRGALDRRFAEADACFNCGAALSTPFCSACGQKRATRLGARTIRDETWERVRYFEADLVKSAWRVLLRPGVVAREYVLGARKKHVHPLKLLLTAIVVLVLTVNQTGYLQTSSATASRAMEIVRAYAQWSFSLGVLAIFLAAVAVFAWSRTYRLIEIAVLALYTHFVVLAFNIANLAPLLLFRDAETMRAHKMWSPYYKDWIEAGIVAVAFAQFFAVDWRREWWKPLLGAALFVAFKKGIVQLGAYALVRAIMAGWL